MRPRVVSPPKRKALSDAQIENIKEEVAKHGAAAYPVYQPDFRVCEMAVYKWGMMIGAVLASEVFITGLKKDRLVKFERLHMGLKRLLTGR